MRMPELQLHRPQKPHPYQILHIFKTTPMYGIIISTKTHKYALMTVHIETVSGSKHSHKGFYILAIALRPYISMTIIFILFLFNYD